MDEDEEVDIVGGLDHLISKNEREISNISSGQILSCEYTVHPRWLADNNDAAELWPSNLPRPTSQDEMELVQDEVVIEEPAPIDFDRWCEEQETEEPSNCNDIIFEQDIPASLEEEVITNSNEETELDENSDNCSQSSQQTIEECSNRSPDIYVPNSINSCNSCAVDDDEKPLVKFKQTLLVNKALLKLNQRKLTINPKAGTSILKSNVLDKGVEHKVPVKVESVAVKSEPKFNQSLVIKRISPNSKYQKSTKFTIKKIKSRPFGGGKAKTGGKNIAHNDSTGLSSGGGKTKKFVDLHGENITINHEADECVDTDDDIGPVVSPITIKKEHICSDSESDIEVDIETETPNDLIESHQLSSSAINPILKPEPEPIELRKVPPLKIKTLKRKEFVQPTQVDTKQLSPELQETLNSLELPKDELVLLPQNITEIEKYFHPEFFVGRPTKTPERYLKIRDFIIHVWNDLKPGYVSKTTVRNGLKHCGDVNCISRIHCMLEQIGTINIGQSGEHFQYIRPLSKLKEHFMQSAQNKKTQSTSSNYDVTTMVMGRRQRNKSITFSSSDKEIDANYTVSHVNGVPQLVYAAMPKEREHPRREASKPLKIEFELIECLRFAKDKIPPFKISMSLSTLLCLYLHALSSKYEVMGFLGGYCSKSCGRNKLSLTRYKPTKTASQTGTTCEMCPVSQVEQAANLTSEGYDLLGWFHSHPTFEPNPSRTDVATQADMQLQFSMESDRPFIGFILGCMDMSYNCMYIMPKDLHNKDTFDIIPYGFEVDIIKDCSSLQNDIADVFNVIDRQCQNYVQTIQNFTRTATELLKYHGFELNISEYLRNYL